MDFKDKLIKDFEKAPVKELPLAPVYALQGVSKKDAQKLEKAFGIVSIRDLAELKYVQWAEAICELADSGAGEVEMLKFKDRLDKKYEKKSFKAIAKAPTDALQGLSRKDALLLEKAFKIKTVRSLAKLKYAAWAREIVARAEAAASPLKKEQERKNRTAILFLLMLLLVGAGILLFPRIIKKSVQPKKDVPGKATVPSGEKKMETAAPEKAKLTDETKKAPIKRVKPKAPVEMGKVAVGEDGVKYYNVAPSDDLILISKKVYGDWSKWRLIYNANRKIIKNPNLIFPGQHLVIPDSETK